MRCFGCGREIPDDSRICYLCGAEAHAGRASAQPSLRTVPPTAPHYTGPLRVPKSRLAAGLLGVFLGGLGVHRFYLGFVGVGLAQIVVTCVTCGAGWVWGFVEGIFYLAGVLTRDADGQPLRD